MIETKYQEKNGMVNPERKCLFIKNYIDQLMIIFILGNRQEFCSNFSEDLGEQNEEEKTLQSRIRIIFIYKIQEFYVMQYKQSYKQK